MLLRFLNQYTESTVHTQHGRHVQHHVEVDTKADHEHATTHRQATVDFHVPVMELKRGNATLKHVSLLSMETGELSEHTAYVLDHVVVALKCEPEPVTTQLHRTVVHRVLGMLSSRSPVALMPASWRLMAIGEIGVIMEHARRPVTAV
jgi:hypothetical protein